MKRNRCIICSGKVVNGICAVCGMHNDRSDDGYRLNEDYKGHQAVTHVHKEAVSQRTPMHTSSQGQQRDQEKTKPGNKSAYAIPDQSEHYSSQGSTDSRPADKLPTYYGAKKVNHSSGNEQKVLLWIIAAIVIIGIIYQLGFKIFNSQEEKSSIVDNSQTVNGETDEVYGEDSTYSFVKRELSETGDTYQLELTAGCYEVGIDLPEGKYSAELLNYNGTLLISDWDNGINIWKYFGEGENAIRQSDDLRLYRGAKVQIDGGISIRLTTENGQLPDMVIPISNPLSQEIDITGTKTAGIDFPAGTYDLTATSGVGLFHYTVPGQQEDDYSPEFGIMLNSAGSDESSSLDYKNVVLPEGTKIDVQRLTVKLVPSKRILSEDYASYYHQW